MGIIRDTPASISLPNMHAHSKALQYNPDTDQVVRETGKEGLAISRPSKRGTLWPASFLSELSEVRSEVINNRSAEVISKRPGLK